MSYQAMAEGVTEEQADIIYDCVGAALTELEDELGIPYIAWGGSWAEAESVLAVASVKAYRETAALLDKLARIRAAIDQETTGGKHDDAFAAHLLEILNS